MKCKECKKEFDSFELENGFCYDCCKKEDTPIKSKEPITSLTKEKEIYNTSYVDKSLPTIIVTNKTCDSMTEWDELSISVSDVTAKGALNVFKEIIKELGLENNE